MNDGRRRYVDVPRSNDRIARDIDDEIRFDIDMRIRELVAQGLSRDAARERATQEFGDIEATRAYCATLDGRAERATRWSRWWDEARHDCTVALRAMRMSPGFASVVLITLAVGLGVNVAIYSVVRRMLVDRLPYRDASTLVRIAFGGGGTSAFNGFVSPVQLRDFATQPSLDGVAAFGNVGMSTYYDATNAEPVPMASVTPNFFVTLGVTAWRGRTFGDGDVAADAPPSVIVSYDFWQQELHSDSTAIGHAIRLAGGARTVVGIMPRAFVSPQFKADLWFVMNVARLADMPRYARAPTLRAIARLRSGVSTERATADAATLAARWRADGVVDAKTNGPRFVPLREAMVGGVRPALLTVMTSALLVLAITCMNIAGLFLARATSRRREMAVRAALGAGRRRLMRQLLTETLIYGVVGGLLGVALAMIVHPVIVRYASQALPALGEIRIDLALILDALAVAMVCGLVVGVLPALAATRVDLRQSMGDGARSASAGGGRVRMRQALVTAQVALAVLLMIGAGLLLRSFNTLIGRPLGYSTENSVLIFNVTLPVAASADHASRTAFIGDVMQRVRALPGVVTVATTQIGPWNGPNNVSIKTSGSTDAESRTIDAKFLTATEDYFTTIGTRILRGRSIASTDRPGNPPVVLLSESAARQLFGNVNPIGRRIIVDPTAPKPDPGHEVIGIVEDFRESAATEGGPSIYVSDWQDNSDRWAQFIVRTRGDASRLIPALRPLVHDVSPESPLMFPRTMREVLHLFVAPQELSLTLFGVFALLALTLAALGVYGVMSFVVASRTREFGIRTALGARRGTIVALVIRQGMRAAAIGAALGILIAFVGTRVLAKLLVGVTSHDLATFVAAPAILLIVTLLACAIPARRATQLDPLEALRGE